MKDCMGLINLDEKEEKIIELTKNRTLASLPIAGRYRVIDFILSNMTNSGIESIGIFTKNKSRVLIDHLTNGRPWDLHRKKDGLRVFNFSDNNLEQDDISSFIENIDFFYRSKQEYILLAPSYMICNIDYRGLIKHHRNSGNDITIVYKNIKNLQNGFKDCEILNIDDEEEKVISIGKNTNNKSSYNVNMEMYLMKRCLFIDILHECMNSGLYRKINKYIKSNLEKLIVGGYEFNGYLACINSTKSYYDANMEFLIEKVNKELFYGDSPIYTKSKDEGPTQYTEDSKVLNSIVANGALIEGYVENCVIGRRVKIGKNTVIKNSIILQSSEIENDVILDKAIIDKESTIKRGEEVKGLIDSPVTISIIKDI